MSIFLPSTISKDALDYSQQIVLRKHDEFNNAKQKFSDADISQSELDIIFDDFRQSVVKHSEILRIYCNKTI